MLFLTESYNFINEFQFPFILFHCIFLRSHCEIFSVTKYIYLVKNTTSIYTWKLMLYIHIPEICDSCCSKLGRKILRYFIIFWYLLNLTERQFWVTSLRCVFLSKILFIQANTAHSSSKIVFYCTKIHFRLPRSLIVRKISDTQKNTRFVCITKIY